MAKHDVEQIYYRRKRAGQCPGCGGPRSTRVYCADCLAHHRQRVAAAARAKRRGCRAPA